MVSLAFFLKVCWPLVKYDFYRLCQEFWEGSVNLQSINDSIKITLLGCSIKITSILWAALYCHCLVQNSEVMYSVVQVYTKLHNFEHLLFLLAEKMLKIWLLLCLTL
jgi:hypothetical protein